MKDKISFSTTSTRSDIDSKSTGGLSRLTTQTADRPGAQPGDIKTIPMIDSVRFPLLKQGLQKTYRNTHRLCMPLSDKPFPIQAVSLTVNEKSVQEAQRRKLSAHKHDEKEKKPGKKKDDSVAWSSQLQREEDWHKVEKPLEIKAIFTPDELDEDKAAPAKSIQRVLMEGRAGVGKTTFSQYITWQWAAAGLFSREYDYVLLVPLRLWLNAPLTHHFQEELAAFIHERYYPAETTADRFKELQAILGAEHSSRTLLILDGYDEVAHHLDEPDSTHAKLLLEALAFKHVIVTTRDYQLPPAQIRFDRQLVNIGFTDTQIKHYLQNYAQWLNPDPQERKAEAPQLTSPADSKLSRALQQNSRLWALAHVPLNLALIVEVFGDELLESKDNGDSDTIVTTQEINLTSLYQKVLECFLLRELARHHIKPKVYTLQTLRNRQFITLDALGLLAWEAFQADEIMLTLNIQHTALNRLTKRYPQLPDIDIEAHFIQALNMGLLRSEGPALKNPLDQTRYFIHLTFQEYFTAYYLLQNLQGYYGIEAYEHSITWIGQHKYEPRYAVVMGFLAGMSTEIDYAQALKAFWHALLSPPHDIIGSSHVRLIMFCLEEARFNERIPAGDKLLRQLIEWINYSFKHPGWCKWFIDALYKYPQVMRHRMVVAHSIKALQNEDKVIRGSAAEALGEIGKIAPTTSGLVPGLLQALQDNDYDVRRRATEALGKIGQIVPAAEGLTPGLLHALQEKDSGVRHWVAQALSEIAKSAPVTEWLVPYLSKFLHALHDTDKTIRCSAVQVLGEIVKIAPTIEGITPPLLQALQDQDKEVRCSAILALEGIGKITPVMEMRLAPSLLQAMQEDKEQGVRRQAARALSNIGKITPHIEGLLPGLRRALQNKNVEVRQQTVDILGEIGQIALLPEELVAGLLQGLQDKEPVVRFRTVIALGKMGKTFSSVKGLVEGLVQAIEDHWDYVRIHSIKALGDIGKIAPDAEGLVPALQQALQNKRRDVRSHAAQALNKINEIIPAMPPVNKKNDQEVERKEVSFSFLMTSYSPDDNSHRGDVILRHVCKRKFPGFVLNANSLRVITGTHSESISIPHISVLQFLLTKIQEKGLPTPPTLAECEGKSPRYPAAKKPEFRPSMIPASSILSVKPYKNQASGSVAQNEILSHSQRVNARLKLHDSLQSPQSLLTIENGIPENYPEGGFNGDLDLKQIRQYIYNHKDYEKINYLALYVGIPCCTALRFFLLSPYHQFPIIEAGKYSRSHQSPHAKFVGKINLDYKFPSPVKRNLKGAEISHLGLLHPPEQALQNSQQLIKMNKKENGGDGGLYDSLLIYRNKTCRDIVKKFFNEVTTAIIVPGYYNEYPCIMVYTPFFFLDKPKFNTRKGWTKAVVCYFMGLINFKAQQAGIAIELVMLRPSFGFLTPTIDACEDSFRLSVGIIPAEYGDILVDGLKILNQVFSLLKNKREEFDLTLPDDIYLRTLDYKKYLDEKQVDLPATTLELLLAEKIEKTSAGKSAITNLVRTPGMQIALALYVYEELMKLSDFSDREFTHLFVKFLKWGFGHVKVKNDKLTVEYPLLEKTYESFKDSKKITDPHFWELVSHLTRVMHQGLGKEYSFPLARKIKELSHQLNADIQTLMRQKKLNLLYYKLEKLNELLRVLSIIEPHDDVFDPCGSDSETEDEVKKIYGKKVIVGSGMRAIIVACSMAIDHCRKFKAEPNIFTYKMYYESKEALKLLKIKALEIEKYKTKDKEKADILMLDSNAVVKIPEEQLSPFEVANKTMNNTVLIVDSTSSTLSTYRSWIDFFKNNRRLQILFFVASGLKNEQIGADNNHYGTIRVFTRDKKLLDEIMNNIKESGEEFIRVNVSHRRRRLVKQLGGAPRNSLILQNTESTSTFGMLMATPAVMEIKRSKSKVTAELADDKSKPSKYHENKLSFSRDNEGSRARKRKTMNSFDDPSSKNSERKVCQEPMLSSSSSSSFSFNMSVPTTLSLWSSPQPQPSVASFSASASSSSSSSTLHSSAAGTRSAGTLSHLSNSLY